MTHFRILQIHDEFLNDKGGTHDQTCLSYMYARTCLSNMNVRVLARKRFKHVRAYKKSVKLLNLALPENKSVR
jgi:hypothetical protein